MATLDNDAPLIFEGSLEFVRAADPGGAMTRSDPVTGSPPRRDNGLTATSYVRLDRRRDAPRRRAARPAARRPAVAAYSAPGAGPARALRRHGAAGRTRATACYVDAAARELARAVTDAYLREIRDDLAWADIVAGFDRDASELDDAVPRVAGQRGRRPQADGTWPQPRDRPGPTIGVRGAARRRRPPPPSYAGTDPPTTPTTTSVPPPPPPLPDIDRVNRFAWAGALGGPLLLVLAALAGLQLDGWVGLLALLAFMAGFVTLVVRMKPRNDSDSGPDDGAVV